MKEEIRETILQEKIKFSETMVKEKSLAIFNTLKETDFYKNADNVMLYITLENENEVPTDLIIDDLLNKGKRIFVPLTVHKTKELIVSELKNVEKDLKVGNFGVLEPKKEATRPVDPSILDIVIVPGVVFDKRGYRIGHGAGYYDRFLPKLSKKTTTVSLVFDMQLIDKVPIECHDIAVEYIITEKQFIKCIKDNT
ncbi:MAG TPA: 5-formyltetrahydrofolate cyclo-ligase [Oscillospiraceae bacterium]|nr:5-formyltetrahydrofolate cyclo-ligase [Oscillospiraceae bacterium]